MHQPPENKLTNGSLTYFIIFGAAVRADGSPSGSLRRRIEGALALSAETPNCKFIVTGGVGRHPPAEALVMRDLLKQSGVPDEDILLDCEATDTLSSVINCATILRKCGDATRVVVCSSGYHNPRCAWLLRLIGQPASLGKMPRDRPHLGCPKWLYYVLREIPAIAWDTLLLLVHRLGDSEKD